MELPHKQKEREGWKYLKQLTGDAAVYHPADHAQQEEQVTHEVAVIPTSCRSQANKSCPVLVVYVCLWLRFVKGKFRGVKTEVEIEIFPTRPGHLYLIPSVYRQ